MINFPFETNRKLMLVGVPILKHFRVYKNNYSKFVSFRYSDAFVYRSSNDVNDEVNKTYDSY